MKPNLSNIIAGLAGVCLVVSPVVWPLLNVSAWWLVGSNAWWLLIVAVLKLERKNVA
jgi:hypothetical protein